jgi:hypothetical protein
MCLGDFAEGAVTSNTAAHHLFSFMGRSSLSPVIHRKWAREFLARAEAASDRRRKLGYLKLAVSNSVRAQSLEAKQETVRAPGDGDGHDTG